MSKIEEQAFQKIDALIGTIETIADPATRSTAQKLVQALMDLHGAGIERMLEIAVAAGAPGEALIDGFARDELVGSLLVLYGLHPLELAERVEQALEKVRPYLGSHGGNVELLGVTDAGVVRLRLQGSCHGCPSSAMTLKLAIEEAIYAAAPDVTALEVEGVVEQPARPSLNFIPLEPMGATSRPAKPDSNGWEQVDGLTSLGHGGVRTLDVSGHSVLFCRVDEVLYAYGNSCPSCGKALSAARVEATALACPTCGQHYDILRAGRGIDKPSLHLDPLPLLVERGQARVAIPNFGL